MMRDLVRWRWFIARVVPGIDVHPLHTVASDSLIHLPPQRSNTAPQLTLHDSGIDNDHTRGLYTPVYQHALVKAMSPRR